MPRRSVSGIFIARDNVGCRGNDGRDRVDGGYHRHDVPEHREIGDGLGMEVWWRPTADIIHYCLPPVDLMTQPSWSII